VLKVVSKRWVAELAMDDRVAGGHERIGSGERVNFAPGNGALWCTFYAIFYSHLAGIIIIQNTVKQRQSRLGLHTHSSPEHK